MPGLPAATRLTAQRQTSAARILQVHPVPARARPPRVRLRSDAMADAPYKLILLRHGESEWNAKNLFTGWVDVNLNEKGEKEAVRGGELLKDAGLLPDVVHTSLQKRAIRTAQLGAGGRRPPLDPRPPLLAPERAPLRRAPGQGQGADARRVRRGAVHALAPLVRHPAAARWRTAPSSRRATTRATRPSRRELRPRTECLKDVVTRMLPYWYDGIVPDLLDGRTVLVAAHGNSLRAPGQAPRRHLRRRTSRA